VVECIDNPELCYAYTDRKNFSVLNLLKNETTTKYGIKEKRLKAGWDNMYLKKY